MNKKSSIIVAVIVGALLIGGGALAYNNSQNNKEADKMAMQKKDSEKKAMEASAMAKDDAMKKDVAMVKDGDTMKNADAMVKSGSYVTLADYNANTAKYADSKKVYFFHASWCPICQGIDKEISADMSKIPAGVTLIKTDFDSSTQLRQKYGVTTQYTFVQVDNSGNKTAQWSATSLDKVIAGIKS